VVTYVLPALPLEVAAEVVAREFEDTCALTRPVNRANCLQGKRDGSTVDVDLKSDSQRSIDLAARDLASRDTDVSRTSVKLASRRGTFDRMMIHSPRIIPCTFSQYTKHVLKRDVSHCLHLSHPSHPRSFIILRSYRSSLFIYPY